MRIRKNIARAIFFFLISANSFAGPSFQFLSFELAQNYSKSLERFDTAYNLGLGIGKVFEKGTIELNPLIILDDQENTRINNQSAIYKLHGFLIGLEYNQILNPIMTFGAGVYYELANETFASEETKLTLAENKENSYLACMQMKFFLPQFRPYLRIQFGSKVHDYSFILGTSLIHY